MLVTLSVVVVLSKRWSRKLMVLLLCAVVLDVLSAVPSVLDVHCRTRGGSLGDSRSAVLVVVVDRESCWTPKKTKVAPRLLLGRPASQ